MEVRQGEGIRGDIVWCDMSSTSTQSAQCCTAVKRGHPRPQLGREPDNGYEDVLCACMERGYVIERDVTVGREPTENPWGNPRGFRSQLFAR
jgi:hypothetical protein